MANARTSGKNAVWLAGALNLTAQTSCQIPAGQAGFWYDGSTVYLRRANGTDADIGGTATGPFFVAITKTTVLLAGAPVYDNGTAGVGATLTKATNGAIGTVGGVALTSADVGKAILVDQQGSAFQNGIYLLTAAGAAGSKWVLTRLPGFDTAGTIIDGAQCAVQQGTSAGLIYNQTATVATVGTDSIAFALSATAVTFTAVNAALAVANADIAVNSQKITGLAAGAAGNAARVGDTTSAAGTGASGGTSPAFTGTASTTGEATAFSGTGFATAGQVVTTTDNQTMGLDECAGMWLIAATQADRKSTRLNSNHRL